MKRNNLLSLMLVASVAFFSSCSKDDDHDHAEHCSDDCHLVLPNPAYVSADSTPGVPAELAWDIVDASGNAIQFCDDTDPSLDFLESANWEYTTPHELASDMAGVDPLPAGTYSAARGYECHCEEHNH